jgi:Ras-related protein Rab-6A
MLIINIMSRRNVKCFLIGDSNVGKTSIIRSYFNKPTNVKFPSTMGLDFLSKTVIVSQETIVLSVWDTAGAERFHALTSQYVYGADVIIVCYEVTQKKSNLVYWMRLVEQVKPKVVGILGTKNDLTTSFSEDLDELLFPWTRQNMNIIMGVCSSRQKQSVQKFFKRCLMALPNENQRPEPTHLAKINIPKSQTRNRMCCT